jgi:soluble lytic murein transglycosylase-like protein
MRLLLSAAALLFALRPCPAKELVYLASGFTLEIESHSQQDQTIVCRTATGTLELQATDVERIDVLADSPVAPAPAAEPNRDVLQQAASAQGLPPEFIRSVAKIESGFRQDAISAKGAIGLMQLMPRTAIELGVEPTRADENAQGGARYLRELLLRYHYDSALALAAYNAGPGAVDKYHGVPPYVETRQYVLKVLREYERQQKSQVQSAIASSATK